MRSFFTIVSLIIAGAVQAQSLIPFQFISEDENRLLKETDSIKYYVASGDSMNTVSINEDAAYYKLLNRERKVIAEGAFIPEIDKFLQEGKWTERFDNGKTKTVGYFHKSMPMGTWQEFYSSGKLKRVTNYGIFVHQGETLTCMSGTYQEYYQSGKIKVNGFYSSVVGEVNDTIQLTDPVTRQDVIKIMKRNTLVAERTGHWDYYDENGDLIKKEDE